MKSIAVHVSAKEKLLDAARAVIREKGYTATTVDDLCAQAGVTKGAFFHHFESKEALAIAAAHEWSTATDHFFKQAPYQSITDPLQRLLGYIDFRKSILKGDIAEFTCLVGTMVQETYQSNPAIREACQESIFGHAAQIAAMIQAAKTKYAPHASWTAASLGLHTQAVIQGAFILAKAKNKPDIAAETIAHLRRYIQLLFQHPTNKERS